MKLNILSDLHLGQSELAPPANDADLVVLAGDVARPAQALAWAQRAGKPVIFVAGNHEFYGGSLAGTAAQLEELSRDTRVDLLDQGSKLIGNVRFLGCTLWTDFMLFGQGPQREHAIEQAVRFMRDFSRIRLAEDAPHLFTPAHSAALFQRHAAWLARELDKPHDGPTVVVTHHAPSRGSIHPRFADSPINACFVSDADWLLDGSRVQLWIHGHTHDSFDYVRNGTRVVCNPRGYARDGVNENAAFDPDFMVEVG